MWLRVWLSLRSYPYLQYIACYYVITSSVSISNSQAFVVQWTLHTRELQISSISTEYLVLLKIEHKKALHKQDQHNRTQNTKTNDPERNINLVNYKYQDDNTTLQYFLRQAKHFWIIYVRLIFLEVWPQKIWKFKKFDLKLFAFSVLRLSVTVLGK